MAATLLAPPTARRVAAPFTAASSTSRRLAVAPLAALQPTAVRQLQSPTTTRSRRALVCRAADGEGQQPGQQPQQGQAPPAAEGGAAKQRAAPEDPSVAKGQRTAIITGAISILFGVVYLALVSFLDMRGGEMLPPPPEAFGP